MTGTSDPLVVAQNFLSLSQSERGRAAMYRSWVAESLTEPERQKWQHEADKQDEAADYHAKKYAQYMETIDA